MRILESQWNGSDDFEKGQVVRIIDGPYTGFMGIAEEVNQADQQATVDVSFFGKETFVHLNFVQLEKLT